MQSLRDNLNGLKKVRRNRKLIERCTNILNEYIGTSNLYSVTNQMIADEQESLSNFVTVATAQEIISNAAQIARLAKR